MKAPEITYNYQQLIDTAGGSLGVVLRRVQVDDTAATLNGLLYTVPGDKILVLTSIGVGGVPGATQKVSKLSARIVEESSALTGTGYAFVRSPDVDNDTADRQINLSWCGELWVSPGEQVAFRGNFDAGVASNTIVGMCGGLLIPRGNVQQA